MLSLLALLSGCFAQTDQGPPIQMAPIPAETSTAVEHSAPPPPALEQAEPPRQYSKADLQRLLPELFSQTLPGVTPRTRAGAGYPDLEALRREHNDGISPLVRRILQDSQRYGTPPLEVARDYRYLLHRCACSRPRGLSAEGREFFILATAESVLPHEQAANAPPAVAFRAMWQRGSRDLFEQLAIEAVTDAGKAYGMAGLYLTDRTRFEELAAVTYENREIGISSECITHHWSWPHTNDIIREYLTQRLTGQPAAAP